MASKIHFINKNQSHTHK